MKKIRIEGFLSRSLKDNLLTLKIPRDSCRIFSISAHLKISMPHIFCKWWRNTGGIPLQDAIRGFPHNFNSRKTGQPVSANSDSSSLILLWDKSNISNDANGLLTSSLIKSSTY